LKAPASAGNWTPKGPSTSDGGYAGIGRINCMAFHPTNENIFWVGTPSGGLWKTTNFGATWTTVTDNLPVLGVSDIAINPANPNIMYIATGDGDGGSLWGCTGSPGGDTQSIGILKSTDGGANWSSTSMNWDVQEVKFIRRLIINPVNPNILYAAASDGIWKTTDAGSSWINVFPDFYFMDIEFKPGDPNTIYASTFDYNGDAEVKISFNGGNNWYTSEIDDNVLRINLEVSPATPGLVEGMCSNTSGALAGFIESTDSFSTYNWRTATPGTGNYLSSSWPLTSTTTTGQGWYDLAYSINPLNSDERWLGGVVTYVTYNAWNSDNYLASFWAPGNGNPGVPVVHADKHFFTFHPLNPSYFFDCNDGGIYYTDNGGATWNDISNGLQISQIYRIGNSATIPEDIMCGLQDNGTKEYFNGNWIDGTGGDGMECAIDPVNALIEYSSYVYGEIYRTLDGWNNYTTISANLPGGQQTGAWVTPYVIDPNNPQTLYAGYHDVYKTTDRGNSWTKLSNNLSQEGTLKSIAIAPGNSQYIYAADFWFAYKSTNGGSSWSTISNKPTNGNISYIAVSPTEANTIYIAISGYYTGEKVFKSTNGGASWTNISGSLPNLPVNCIVYEDGSNEGLYIGTDVGVYYKNATMSDWTYFSTGLPNVVVTELDIQYSSSLIRAGSFGRGLWESPLYVASNYQIATSANPANGGTTTGGGSYTEGTQCTVTGTAAANWNFTNWTENGNVVSNTASYTFIVTANRTLVANFTQQPSYIITTSANPTNGGTTTGAGTYNNGQQCTVTATPTTNYNFVNWTEGGNVVSTSAAYSFTVNANRTLTANFSLQQFTVTTASNPTNGGSTSGGGTFSYGATVIVNASASANWNFTSWTENGNVVSNSASYSFIISANRTLVANFTQQPTYTITTNANPANGGATAGGGTYTNGQQCTVTASPANGYNFINWTEGGNVVSTSAAYSFTVNANRTLTANFSIQQFYITTTPNPANGGSTNGGGTFNYGTTVTVNATANANWFFTNWTENGNIVSNSASYSFIITANRTLVANFTQQPTYTITTITNPANAGTTTGGGSYTNGQQCTVTATPANGYSFTNWTEGGNVVSTSAAYSFTVNANRTLTANFSLQQYTVTTASNPANGGATSGGGTFNYGSTITVNATASANWFFTSWSENGNTISSNPAYSFTLTSNRNLLANFTQQTNQYTVTATANPINGGYTTGGGTYNGGAQVTVNAVASSGWTFVNWTEFGSQISTNPSYVFTINSNRDLVANFIEQFIITATANPINGGYTTGGGSYNAGQTAVVRAFANSGYEFQQWRENGNVVSTSPTYSFVVITSRNLTAEFTLEVGIPENHSTDFLIYPNPASSQLFVEIPDELILKVSSLELNNSSGKLVWKYSEGSISDKVVINISQLPAGLYNLIAKTDNGQYFTSKVIIKK